MVMHVIYSLVCLALKKKPHSYIDEMKYLLVYLSILSICVSEIFIFVCFVVVMVGGAGCDEVIPATLGVSALQLIVDTSHALRVFNIVN